MATPVGNPALPATWRATTRALRAELQDPFSALWGELTTAPNFNSRSGAIWQRARKWQKTLQDQLKSLPIDKRPGGFAAAQKLANEPFGVIPGGMFDTTANRRARGLFLGGVIRKLENVAEIMRKSLEGKKTKTLQEARRESATIQRDERARAADIVPTLPEFQNQLTGAFRNVGAIALGIGLLLILSRR